MMSTSQLLRDIEMKKVKVIVISGYGINCEEETKFAFEKAGGQADIVHINDLINNPYKLSSYQIAAFPGGFAFGDDTGSGVAFANKIKSNIWEEFEKFVERDNLIIGICNGFQMLTNLGLIPGFNKDYGKREVALVHNESARYINRWVDVKVENNSPWLKGIKTLSVPIAHGEGKLVASEEVLKKLRSKNMIALKYFPGEMHEFSGLPANPTGTLENIAGLTDETGRIFGLMPHPERAMFFAQRPDWQSIREKLKGEGVKLPEFADGIKIFQNGINYFK